MIMNGVIFKVEYDLGFIDNVINLIGKDIDLRFKEIVLVFICYFYNFMREVNLIIEEFMIGFKFIS